MSDNQGLVQNNVALTSELQYALKPSCPAGTRMLRSSIPPSNSTTFRPSFPMIWEIPAGRRNTYMDGQNAVLKLSIRNNDTTAGNFFNLDNMGGCLIERIDVFNSSVLLETIQGANILYSYMSDFQLSSSSKSGLSTNMGFNSSVMGSESRRGATVFAGQILTVTIPIIGGLFMQSSKYTPLFALSDDIRLEVILSDNNIGVVYGQATNNTEWSIVNAELELNIIELSDGQSMVEESTPFSGPIHIASTSYRHYVSTQPAASAGSFSILLSARYASLRNLIVCPRNQLQIVDPYSYSVSSRINPNWASYYFRIGSTLVPSRPVVLQSNNSGGYSEAFDQVLKSFHASSSLLGTGIDAYTYQINDSVDTTVGGQNYTPNTNTLVNGGVGAYNSGSYSYKNGFAVAIELESFSQKSNSILSGVNTLSCNIFLEGVFNSRVTNLSSGYSIDMFSCFDIIYEINDGLITVKY